MHYLPASEIQAKRRFWFYIIFTFLCIVLSFYGGFRLGRAMEREHWLDTIAPKAESSSKRNS